MTNAFDDMIERAKQIDILQTALRCGAELRRHGHEHVGPCPAGCASTDGFAVNTRDQIFICRPGDGKGDVIALVMHCQGLEFKAAVAWLLNEDLPARETKVPDAKDATKHRDDEISKARGIWDRGHELVGTEGEAYLAARGLSDLPLAITARLRFADKLSYWHMRKGASSPDILFHGPALLGIMSDELGVHVGTHITWLDADKPGAKATIEDPDKPGEFLPAKKMRGSKRRAAERLVDPQGARRLMMGEGRETVLSVWKAELERMGELTGYWAALDLGHLAGKAHGKVKHPSAKSPTGRAVTVPDNFPVVQPDRDLIIPDCVEELILLGDGDSDRFTTQAALERAARKYYRQGRVIRIAWAPDGQDFNDLIRRAA